MADIDVGERVREVLAVPSLPIGPAAVRRTRCEDCVDAVRRASKAVRIAEVRIYNLGTQLSEASALAVVSGARRCTDPVTTRQELMHDFSKSPRSSHDKHIQAGLCVHDRLLRSRNLLSQTDQFTLAMDSERRIAPMVMQLHAALVSELHERLSDAGYQSVRSPHCQVLGLIAPGGSRLTDLAAATVMTRQSMGALVDYLEQLGYVERVGDPDDARAKLIRKTRRGDAAAVAVGQVGKEMEQAWADQIGPRRLEQLRAALSAILGRAP